MCAILLCNSLLLSGQAAYFEAYTLATHLPDDMTIGPIIGESRASTFSYSIIIDMLGTLLGYNLTDVGDNMMGNIVRIDQICKVFMWLFNVNLCSSYVVKFSSSLVYRQLFISIGWQLTSSVKRKRSNKSSQLHAVAVYLYVVCCYVLFVCHRAFLLYHCLLYPTVPWCKQNS